VPIAIAHRAPSSATRCAELLALGATVFEIDVQAVGPDLVSSHFLPITAVLPRLRRDGLALTWRRRDPREIALAEAVAVIPRPARILLDLKTDTGAAAEALVEAVATAGLEPGRFLVSTRGWHTLAALRGHGYPVWRTVADEAALRAVLRLDAVPDAALTVAHNLLSGPVVAALQTRAPAVMAWTVNDLDRARRLLDLGVDGITSDRPEVLREVAATRR